MFSAHGVAPVVHDEAAARQARDHRRDLPAGHQGPQGSRPVRQRGLRHPPDRPRGPRGGHRHLRRGARPHHARRRPRRTSPKVEVRDESKVVWLSQTTLSVDETMETVDALKERFPQLISPAQRRHLLRHAEPPDRGQADGRRGRPGHRRRLQELLELGPAGRGRQARPAPAPPTWWTSPTRSTRPGWRA